jgi:hypothetical protein
MRGQCHEEIEKTNKAVGCGKQRGVACKRCSQTEAAAGAQPVTTADARRCVHQAPLVEAPAALPTHSAAEKWKANIWGWQFEALWGVFSAEVLSSTDTWRQLIAAAGI